MGFLIGGSILFLAIFAAMVTGVVILQKRRIKSESKICIPLLIFIMKESDPNKAGWRF